MDNNDKNITSAKSEKPKFYLTTAIAYASAKPHIGNTYEIIMADAIARYKRAMGYDVYFCTGTDEHGQKIENLAKKHGVTPKEYVDDISKQIKDMWDLMNTTYDYFIRTTDENHVAAVQKIFNKYYEKGDIYKGVYEGWYCTPCEAFLTETQVKDGKCPDCGRPVEKATDSAYFFKMSAFTDKLLKYIEDHPTFIEPESRKNEMVKSFLEAGLTDLCVSRTSLKWGIPITIDEGHVIYVWLDALANYITALGYDPTLEEQPERFRKYWPCDVHVIGKDILRFHTIYWPVFLMELGLELPKKIFGHPWFNFGDDKMSKSKGNVLYADKLSKHFGTDGVRYYALSEMPYNTDGSVGYESIIRRYNNDLVNNLGNLVKRTIDMLKKYFNGVVQAPLIKTPLDSELFETADEAYVNVIKCMDDYHIANALEYIFDMLKRTNKYIDETTPWTLAKDQSQKERLGTVLCNILEIIRRAAVMLMPFIPSTSEEIFRQLNCRRELDALELTDKNENKRYLIFSDFIEKGDSCSLIPGTVVSESKALFVRVDEAKKIAEFEAEQKLSAAEAQNDAAAQAKAPENVSKIGIDSFMNVELRTAKVVDCEKVPRAKKLLKLQLDLGYEKRQVVSGIAEFYEPRELIGKKIIVVANLAPAVLCGIESNGMILASGEKTVRVVFLDDDTPLGERVR